MLAVLAKPQNPLSQAFLGKIPTPGAKQGKSERKVRRKQRSYKVENDAGYEITLRNTEPEVARNEGVEETAEP